MKKWNIHIVADINDADYIENLSIIDQVELDKIKPVIEAIRDFKPYTYTDTSDKFKLTWDHRHNWPEDPREDLGEKSIYELYGIDDDLWNLFNDFIPSNCYDNIHTIVSIEVWPETTEKIKLL